jgi:hypothetical protein
VAGTMTVEMMRARCDLSHGEGQCDKSGICRRRLQKFLKRLETWQSVNRDRQ